MNIIVAAIGLALAGVTSAPAFATDFALAVGPGTSSTDFGNTLNASGALADTYTFTIPAGVANSFLGSIALNSSLDVNITSVLLDSTPFTQVMTGTQDLYRLDATNLAAGAHTIFVNGSWGPSGGSYAGTLNYIAAVPEPATWALMIGGFGLIGATIRQRRHAATMARA